MFRFAISMQSLCMLGIVLVQCLAAPMPQAGEDAALNRIADESQTARANLQTGIRAIELKAEADQRWPNLQKPRLVAIGCNPQLSQYPNIIRMQSMPKPRATLSRDPSKRRRPKARAGFRPSLPVIEEDGVEYTWTTLNKEYVSSKQFSAEWSMPSFHLYEIGAELNLQGAMEAVSTKSGTPIQQWTNAWIVGTGMSQPSYQYKFGTLHGVSWVIDRNFAAWPVTSPS